MPEGIKQKMNSDRFIEIFDRYSFEEKASVIEKLKFSYNQHAERIKEDLKNKIDQIEAQITNINNRIQY